MSQLKTVRKFPKTITLNYLRDIGACWYAKQDFKKHWPGGSAPANVESLKKFKLADIIWLADALFSDNYITFLNQQMSSLLTKLSNDKQTVRTLMQQLRRINPNLATYSEETKAIETLDNNYRDKYAEVVYKIATKQLVPNS